MKCLPDGSLAALTLGYGSCFRLVSRGSYLTLRVDCQDLSFPSQGDSMKLIRGILLFVLIIPGLPGCKSDADLDDQIVKTERQTGKAAGDDK